MGVGVIWLQCLMETEVFLITQQSLRQRPDTPEAGMIRFNTEAGQFEYHDGTEWKAISE